MSIPDEAVEAAAYIVGEAVYGDLTAEEAARRILEAAAPHLMRAAWDEGYEQADYDAPHAIKSDNPYKKDGAE